jgi:uncharacterized RDD family membrane protein YckC
MTTLGASSPIPTIERRPAGLLLRLAAMTYEGVLLFGVVFVVAYALLSLARWTYPLAGAQRAVLQAVLFVTLGIYFVYQWCKTGQTLAMKSWQLRLVDATGRPPSIARAIARYVAAWHFVLPGAVYWALFGGNATVDKLALACGSALLLLPGVFDTRRRLLHDRVTQTFVTRER